MVQLFSKNDIVRNWRYLPTSTKVGAADDAELNNEIELEDPWACAVEEENAPGVAKDAEIKVGSGAPYATGLEEVAVADAEVDTELA